ncbi:S-adenosylmethionine decarboxylase proenzyme [Fragariocoptes setiger]|uniref:S-adenosylmethionine decarboxylase proenzyme n=1 Tax=Fragariocoptes setiger TaxID=1670756 RepID=A0ABQ7SBX4_9ACAR|nr:S-adenosylmethionine decarboxylase proenzyme [Fragariocoptes setiger]
MNPIKISNPSIVTANHLTDMLSRQNSQQSLSSPSSEDSSDDISKDIVSDSDERFYEGTEKLLEIWFGRSDNCTDNCDLRKIQRPAWDALLKFAQCEIISFRRTESIDGYVLSESAMFISKDRFIIKTCGQTTLLRCIEPLLYLVREIAGFDEILDVFYSRKSFMRPDLQDKTHSRFDNEIETLDSVFEVGSAYCLGRVNRDCWYLYTLHPEKGVTVPDQTLELIMVDLDEEVMSIFTRATSETARDATIKSGIDKIFPGMVIDDYLFTPCGYSMNGYIKSGHYVTIHITPEVDFSYVSFETNAPQASYLELIQKIIRMFVPGKFIMTIFANEASVAFNNSYEYKSSSFNDYRREELQFCRFKNYELTFGTFAREPS